MKTVVLVVLMMFTFSMTGCILVELNHPYRKGGPPSWAPAHGYRKKKQRAIYYSPSVIIIKKQWHHQ